MADSNLTEKTAALRAESRYGEIVRLLEDVPEKARGYTLTMELARAYNRLALGEDPEEPPPDLETREKHLDRARILFRSVEGSGSDEARWHYDLGCLFMDMEQEGDARDHLSMARELGLDAPDIDSRIEACCRALTRPHFTRSFRERTLQAWEKFEAAAPELERYLTRRANRDSVQEGIDLCMESIRSVKMLFPFTIGREGSTSIFYVTIK